jgi:predicted GIY-YIG superfamily endonuclease
MHQQNYYMYIMSSLSRNRYTVVTNHLELPVGEHKEAATGSSGFRRNLVEPS